MKKFILLVFTICLISAFNNSQAQWVQVSNGIQNRDVQCITSSGINLYAGFSNYPGLYYSSNNGANWLLRGLSPNIIYSLVSNENYIFAGLDTEICRSSDMGVTWTRKGIQYAAPVNSIAISGSNLMLSAQNMGAATIYYSSDNGNNWSNSTGATGGITRITAYQNHFYVSSGSPPFTSKHSSNYGLNWSSGMIWPIGRPQCIGANSNYVFAGTSKYIYYDTTCAGGFCKSSDYGSSWAISGLTQKNINAMVVYGNNIIAGTQDSGIYVSSDNGLSWVKKSEGLSAINTTNTLYIFNNYVYAGIQNQAVWRRPLSELINGIRNISSEYPESYNLFQNYPNPFNPVTNIRYSVKKSEFSIQNSEVKLVVYNTLGKEIVTLVKEKQASGTYEVNWNASGYTSGIYFYVLYSDGIRVDTKKMILIK